MSNIRVGVHESGFPVSGLAGIKFAAEIGVECYQLVPGPIARNFPLTDPALQDAYLECGAKYGVAFPSICVDATMTFALTAPAGTEQSEKAVDAVKKCIDIAARMQMKSVMIGSARASVIRTQEDFDRTIQALQACCDYAADRGVIVTDENYLDTQKNLQMIDRVDRENFNIFFDSQNPYCFSGYDAPTMVLELAPYILKLGQVHVKDGTGKAGVNVRPGADMLGEGDSGFARSIANLKKIGFAGDVFIENFYSESKFAMKNYDDIFALVRKDIASVRDAFDNKK